MKPLLHDRGSMLGSWEGMVKTIHALDEPAGMVISRLRAELQRTRCEGERLTVHTRCQDTVECVRAWARAMALPTYDVEGHTTSLGVMLPAPR